MRLRYPEAMPRVSPTLEGFRAAFRRPSLTFGEILWRWSVGATGWALLFFGFFEYLSTLPVTNGEAMFLRTGHPFFVGQAIAHILRGSLDRAVFSLLVAGLLLCLLWILAASVGRIATTRDLLDYFRARYAAESIGSEDDGLSDAPGGSFRSLLRLNFLRVAVVLSTLLGLVGAGILVSLASPKANPQPGVAFFVFLPLAVLLCLVWGSLNWLLSLAAVFAVRNGDDAVAAISSAVALFRDRMGAVVAVSTWTGMAHLVLLSVATTVAAIPLSAAGFLPGRLIMLAMILVTLLYLAVADWLYMARLAGYVCIAEIPEALLNPPPPVPEPPVPPVSDEPPLQTTIDRDEPILSDLPGLAVET